MFRFVALFLQFRDPWAVGIEVIGRGANLRLVWIGRIDRVLLRDPFARCIKSSGDLDNDPPNGVLNERRLVVYEALFCVGNLHSFAPSLEYDLLDVVQ